MTIEKVTHIHVARQWKRKLSPAQWARQVEIADVELRGAFWRGADGKRNPRKVKATTQRLVLIALASFCNPLDSRSDGWRQGLCWPALRMLAEITGLSIRAVVWALQALEQEGYIEIRRDGGGRGPREYRHENHNLYRVLFTAALFRRSQEGFWLQELASRENWRNWRVIKRVLLLRRGLEKAEIAPGRGDQ